MEVVRAFADRAFACARPWAWNNLPPGLRKTKTLDTFKKHLKAFLFKQRTMTSIHLLYYVYISYSMLIVKHPCDSCPVYGDLQIVLLNCYVFSYTGLLEKHQESLEKHQKKKLSSLVSGHLMGSDPTAVKFVCVSCLLIFLPAVHIEISSHIFIHPVIHSFVSRFVLSLFDSLSCWFGHMACTYLFVFITVSWFYHVWYNFISEVISKLQDITVINSE